MSLRDECSELALLHVWFILVQERTVIGWYTQLETVSRDRAVECIRATRHQRVHVFEVAAEDYLSPSVGTTVDPAVLGWKDISTNADGRDAAKQGSGGPAITVMNRRMRLHSLSFG